MKTGSPNAGQHAGHLGLSRTGLRAFLGFTNRTLAFTHNDSLPVVCSYFGMEQVLDAVIDFFNFYQGVGVAAIL